ncbi:hypothetical protein CEXT_29801 [Caerostris extrusa]|uniref:Uncharacterized protein n=1 Tax=Caerostris extrusa TaxID=172846 RepID=A0AAV4U5X7_CAEEX|nr:hypothetical protein CEXT_29801 [Caerostris extrusa]
MNRSSLTPQKDRPGWKQTGNMEQRVFLVNCRNPYVQESSFFILFYPESDESIFINATEGLTGVETDRDFGTESVPSLIAQTPQSPGMLPLRQVLFAQNPPPIDSNQDAVRFVF